MNEPGRDVIVIGAGAAGLLAAAAASSAGARTLVIEKNRKIGVKILMSGGTRCNITHDTDWRGIARVFGGPQERFLRFSLASLTPTDTVALFQQAGVPTKVESTGKVFPVSDRALDVRDALVDLARNSGASIIAGVAVTDLQVMTNGFKVVTAEKVFDCRRLIVTTGGQSYPGCGTNGEGYRWMSQFGHRIVTPRPALTPMYVADPWVRELAGITIPDVRVAVNGGSGHGKEIAQPRSVDRGSFLFTHRGCSGPVVLNVSRAATIVDVPSGVKLKCDWTPGLDENSLIEQLMPARPGNRQVASALPDVLPRRLSEALVEVSGVDSRMPLAELGRRRAAVLCKSLKHTELALVGTAGFAKAEVTAGGVALDEVDPLTMASRIVPGLYLAGEILDIDGPIGGYNFQAAWSTGQLAGKSAAANP